MLNNKKNNVHKKEIYLILLATFLVTMILFLGAMLLGQGTGTLYLDNTADFEQYRASHILIPSENAKRIQIEADRQIGSSMQYVFMNQTCNFTHGKALGNVRIENREENPYGVKMDLIRTDNGNTIMSTGLIDPGFYVENRALDTPLSKGMYICIAKFTMYDLDTLQAKGEATTQVVVIVRT